MRRVLRFRSSAAGIAWPSLPCRDLVAASMRPRPRCGRNRPSAARTTPGPRTGPLGVECPVPAPTSTTGRHRDRPRCVAGLGSRDRRRRPRWQYRTRLRRPRDPNPGGFVDGHGAVSNTVSPPASIMAPGRLGWRFERTDAARSGFTDCGLPVVSSESRARPSPRPLHR